MPHDFVQITGGENGYARAVLSASNEQGAGTWLSGLELYRNDGPWVVPEKNRKMNGLLRHSQGSLQSGWSVLLMGYHDEWTATDQIAQRAVDAGLIDRFGSLNPTSGGETHRISLSSQWAVVNETGRRRANLYYINYGLDLFSDFTYFLDNPVRGDQVEQVDRRHIIGGSAAHTIFSHLGDRVSDTTVGGDMRYDRIDDVALYLTERRQRHDTVSQAQVDEASIALFLENQTQWLPKFRSILGLRGDFYHFRVAATETANSGRHEDSIASPKLSFIFGPWARTEYYANYDYGFHSNDARGTTQSINPDPRDPDFGQSASTATPLVRARGGELGLRSAPLSGLHTALALWQLELDSELVFQGDAGTTAASRPSRRRGVEWSNYYQPLEGLTVDADFAYSHARFTDSDPAGHHVPGAIERTFSLGVSYDEQGPWLAGLRLRYFGTRALSEADSVRSAASTLVNARMGYRPTPTLQLSLDVLNLLNRKVSDIQYFYNACLRNESGDPRCSPASMPRDGIADTYFHPAEPGVFQDSCPLFYAASLMRWSERSASLSGLSAHTQIA